jgi:hypothetical protein
MGSRNRAKTRCPEHCAERLMGLRKDTEGRRWVPTASCLKVDPA